MADPAPKRRAASPSEIQIQQQLAALSQTCEVLQLRMQEFEEVLLALDQRVRRIQAATAKAALERKPPRVPAPPRVRRRQPPKRRMRHRPLALLLLAAALGGGGVIISRHLTPTAAKIEQRQGQATQTDLTPELQLTARGSTWLEVQTESGQRLHYGMMNPGTVTFPMTSTLRIRAGRPDLVEVLYQNRKQPLGKVNEVDWRLFGAS